MHELSKTQARRIAVRAQLLDRARPAGVHEVVCGLTLLQVDHTAAVAPSADLVLWSRLGAGYRPAELVDELAGRSLVELRQMIRPAEHLAAYRADMANWSGGVTSGWRRQQVEWVAANDAGRRAILDELAASGPLGAKQLPDRCTVPWKSSGWNNNRTVRLLLDLMVQRGEVAVAGRDRRGPLWDLAERVYPDDPVIPADEALRIRNERRLRALGIARAKGPECPVEPVDVGVVGEPAVVQGIRGEWRVDPVYLQSPFRGRTALLSPFDRLILDRKRTVELFDFDYQLEMYKPAAKRRYGYYALPILHGDRFVGRLDATTDRRAEVLRVDAVHADEEWSPALRAAVDREIDDLAGWLGLELMRAD